METESVIRKPIAIPTTLSVVDTIISQKPDLGKDGWLHVFRYLSPSQLLSAALACKHWLHMASDQRLLLKETTSFEYHAHGNPVINGFRAPKAKYQPSERNNRYASDQEDGAEKKEPEVYGVPPPKGANLGYDAAKLFVVEEDD